MASYPQEEPNIREILYSPQVRNANLADYLEDETLNKIGEDVVKECQIDDESCEDWKKRTEPAVKLAMLIWEQKDQPFENAANIKYPLLTSAAIQFSARAGPNIIKGQNVVKAKIIGKDVLTPPKDPQTGQPPMVMGPQGPMPAPPVPGAKSDIASRISQHMSYQVTEQMEEWEEDLDKALVSFPVLGEMWKKTYFDSILKRNKSVFIHSDRIVYNYWAKSLITAPRITEKLYFYPNEVEERKRSGFYSDIDLKLDDSSSDEKTSKMIHSEDPDRPILFLEQHRYLDLDEDGYKEPYIVTVHESSRKVVRIGPRYDIEGVEMGPKGVIRIKPVHYFTQTVFFPSPDGGSRGMGYGNLITPINETVNSTLNQLLDAGTLHNNQSGFIGKGAMPNRGRGGGMMSFKLGEWKSVPIPGDDLRKGIVPLPTKEPSMVLFQLLGLMIEAGKEVSSVTDALTGESSGANMPVGTVMSLIEQGLKVFSSVYKRIHRGLKSEFKKIYRLNSIYLDDEEYYRIMDDEKSITRIDYNIEGIDVIPVSDPSEVSDSAQLIKAQFLQGMMGRGLNDQEITRRVLEAANIPDIDKILNAPPPKPDPMLLLEQDKQKLAWAEYELKTRKGRVEEMKIYGMAMKLLAEAEEIEAGPQIEEYKRELEAWDKQIQRMHEERLASIQAQQRPNNG